MLTAYEWVWLFVAPGTAMSWFHIIKHWRHFVDRPPSTHSVFPRLVFLIAARETNPLVQRGVDSVHRSCEEVGFQDYEVKTVVQRAPLAISRAETIQVPESFVCSSRCKARQLHYALRYIPCSKEVWILHLDEDATVTPHCVHSILAYITGGGKPVANGPSVFPDEKNPLMLFAETNRQWTFYWLKDQLNGGTPYWLNGSNLLVRSDVEHEVGWNFEGVFIGEDSVFGYAAWRKFGHIFGWHGGLTIEASPANVVALLQQRKRWYWSSWLNLKRVPRRWWPRRLYGTLCWNLALFLSVAFWLSLLLPGFETWRGLVWIISFSTLAWQMRYQQGLFWNLQYTHLSRGKKLLYHLAFVLLAPVIDVLCTLPTLWAWLNPPKTFEITAKPKEVK